MPELDRIALLINVRQAHQGIEELFAACAPEGLTFRNAAALRCIARAKKPLSPKALREQLHGPRHSAHNYLGALERQGLIERRKFTHKTVEIHLTRAGRRAAREIEGALADAVHLIWGDLPEADLAAANRAVTQLLERTR